MNILSATRHEQIKALLNHLESRVRLRGLFSDMRHAEMESYVTRMNDVLAEKKQKEIEEKEAYELKKLALEEVKQNMATHGLKPEDFFDLVDPALKPAKIKKVQKTQTEKNAHYVNYTFPLEGKDVTVSVPARGRLDKIAKSDPMVQAFMKHCLDNDLKRTGDGKLEVRYTPKNKKGEK